MKRSKSSSRAMRKRSNETKGITKGNSPYAKKVQRGEQMYGPGCCAHKVTDAQIAAARKRAREEGHKLDSAPLRVMYAA
jgi:hypothetical protein